MENIAKAWPNGWATPRRVCRAQSKPAIWVHAVSVGEVLAVGQLVEDLQRHFPGHRVVISTTTATGQRLAKKRFGEENVFYFPMDFGFAIRPYLTALKPQLIVIAETEFWPNFLRLAHKSGARIAVVNARISDRSWPGYRRLRRLGILPRILRDIDLFLAQTEEDARRLRDIGAPAERIQVSGNLKFDVPAPVPPAIVASLRLAFESAGAGPVVVCGSTVEGEEGLLLSAFQNVLASHPRAVMILAPRHPERFGEVTQLLEQMGLHFWRRSLWTGIRSPAACSWWTQSANSHRSMRLAMWLSWAAAWCPRRPQHHRARPARSAHYRRQPHREFQRHCRTVSEPGRGASGWTRGISAGSDGTAFQRGRTGSFRQPWRRYFTSANGSNSREPLSALGKAAGRLHAAVGQIRSQNESTKLSLRARGAHAKRAL